MAADRSLPWDWFPGRIPANVEVADTAYVESTFSFALYRSTQTPGVTLGHGASMYVGTMFDVGPQGRVAIGEYVLMNAVRIICDSEVSIGNHTLISWNVVLMDTYRVPLDVAMRRRELEQVPVRTPRYTQADVPARPLRIGANVWLGFGVCVLPGVTIGEGAIIGARSVVAENVPPYTVAAGSPARVIRRVIPEEETR
jgi:acetyltransferase-like isoleucine patch superfamily enzyme